MADRDQKSGDDASTRVSADTSSEQSSSDASRGAGSAKSAGSGRNPQDGPDSGEAGASRPRGKTEDPDITL